jgi:hypothetical protein
MGKSNKLRAILLYLKSDVAVKNCLHKQYDDDDQWRYSPDRALASLTGFMIVL